MHHGCWVEELSCGKLPCPTVTVKVPPVLFKNGKVKRAGYVDVDYEDDHGDVMGMRGEWELITGT